MINGKGKISDTAAGQRKYMKRFYLWALRLPERDLRACVMFCQQVQAAWVQGQKDAAEAATTPATLDETPHQGEPKLILPGLGGGSFIAHQEAVPGATYGGLDDMLKGRKPS